MDEENLEVLDLKEDIEDFQEIPLSDVKEDIDEKIITIDRLFPVSNEEEIVNLEKSNTNDEGKKQGKMLKIQIILIIVLIISALLFYFFGYEILEPYIKIE